MKKTLRIVFRVVFSRTIITFLLIALQAFMIFGALRWFTAGLPFIFGGYTLLSASIIVYIINKEGNPAFKLAWILPVCIFPVLGGLLYLVVQMNPGSFGLKARLERRLRETEKYLHTKEEVKHNLLKEEEDFRHISHYIEGITSYSTYQNTKVTYYPLGEDKYKDLLLELEKAKDYIFLEYFIVERGEMWDSILKLLERKAKEGVEVRVMYDGMCSIVLLPYTYPKKLQEKGIKAKMFSPIKPALSTHHNNRDHRKILVIDGKVAFNGGVNLADEYINKKELFGHWKDTAVKIEGEAVQGFTAMFLQMWNVSENGEEDYERYLTNTSCEIKEEGYVIPYGDGSTCVENVAENIYIDMLYTAKEYVHIMTPYLIIDNEMLTALTYAARRGIEVKLLLPHIPDKKVAFAVARTFYPQLIKAGVEIYEYTPGFVHAKSFLSDDCKAIVGTINLDFRSLYLHFECGTYLYKHPVIQDIKRDYENTFAKSQRVTMDDYKRINVFSRLMGYVLRLIGPLM